MQAQMAQCCCDIISTHALTEGDVNLDTFLNIWYISTHALTEGDSAVGSFPTAIFYFNSRPHGGRRFHHRV